MAHVDDSRPPPQSWTAPQPLNYAVLLQALHQLYNGEVGHCECQGFTPEILEALKDPAAVSVLAYTKVSWCSVKIYPDIVQRLLDRLPKIRQEVATIDRMLRLGASTEMISNVCGYTHQEVARRRRMLKLPERKGRWPALGEVEETNLWNRWKELTKARNIDLQDQRSMMDVSMDLAEERSLPLAVVWSAIQDWINNGLT